MTTADTPADPVTTAAAHTAHAYTPYWIAWGVLLAITLVMLLLANPVVLGVAILLKASIITLWFMHLRTERWDLTATIVVGALGCALLLFGLLIPDGLAM